jgi:hypothetical protein
VFRSSTTEDVKTLHLRLGCSVVTSSPSKNLDQETCLGADGVVKNSEPKTAFNMSKVEYRYNASLGHVLLFQDWTEPKQFKVRITVVFKEDFPGLCNNVFMKLLIYPIDFSQGLIQRSGGQC